MSDQGSAAAWMSDWQALQKQFANAWSEAARQAGQPSRPPLQEAFEMWSRFIGGQNTQNDTLDRVLASARQFVNLMQGAAQQAGAGAGFDPSAWTKTIRDSLGAMNLQSNPVADAMRQALGEGSRGFEQMYEQFAQFAQPLRQQFATATHLPAFGFTRERQEQLQKLAQATADYNDQLNRYNALMLKASQRGLEIFEDKLAARTEPGREIKSYREFYDTFIDAAEEGFAEIALSQDYRHVYGALVNAQMRVRQMVQLEVEQASAALGMPTRAELNGTHQKIAELRRRISRLEEALEREESAPSKPPKREVPSEPDARDESEAPRAAKSTSRDEPEATPRATKSAEAPTKDKAKPKRSAPRAAARASKPATRSAAAPARSASSPATAQAQAARPRDTHATVPRPKSKAAAKPPAPLIKSPSAKPATKTSGKATANAPSNFAALLAAQKSTKRGGR